MSSSDDNNDSSDSSSIDIPITNSGKNENKEEGIKEKVTVNMIMEEETKPILVPDESGTRTDLFTEYGFGLSLERSLRSPYLLSNLIYVAYAAIIINIDLNQDVYEYTYINSLYLGANIIHLTNALLYIWVWMHEGFSFFSVIMIPEWLNCIEACLYIASSTFYNDEGYGDGYYEVFPYADSMNSTLANSSEFVFMYDTVTDNVQDIELAASIVSVLAALGWCCTWYLTYRRVPGRGFTFDDPDLTANLTIVIGALLYMIYNCEIINDRSTYGTNYLYVTADWVYVVNSILYLLCALRDAGWFYLMPTAGTFGFEKKFVMVETKKK